jgi:HTH-type transcriptional regulator/antitoxin HigA
MSLTSMIANDRQARDVASAIERIAHALSSEQVLKSIVSGLPREVIDGVRRSLTTELDELSRVRKKGFPERLRHDSMWAVT